MLERQVESFECTVTYMYPVFSRLSGQNAILFGKIALLAPSSHQYILQRFVSGNNEVQEKCTFPYA